MYVCVRERDIDLSESLVVSFLANLCRVFLLVSSICLVSSRLLSLYLSIYLSLSLSLRRPAALAALCSSRAVLPTPSSTPRRKGPASLAHTPLSTPLSQHGPASSCGTLLLLCHALSVLLLSASVSPLFCPPLPLSPPLSPLLFASDRAPPSAQAHSLPQPSRPPPCLPRRSAARRRHTHRHSPRAPAAHPQVLSHFSMFRCVTLCLLPCLFCCSIHRTLSVPVLFPSFSVCPLSGCLSLSVCPSPSCPGLQSRLVSPRHRVPGCGGCRIHRASLRLAPANVWLLLIDWSPLSGSVNRAPRPIG